MIELEKFGYNSKAIGLLVKHCGLDGRSGISALGPIFKQAGIWDALAIDEILRTVSEDENEFQRLINIVNEIGAKKVSIVDLVKRGIDVQNCTPSRVVAFPGLAANKKVFSAIDYGNLRESTVDYSSIDFSAEIDAVISEIITKYMITDECILLGTSFGGLLVNRIAALLKNKHVLMFGALANASELGYWRRLAIRSGISKILPLAKMPKSIVNLAFGITTKSCEVEFYEMLNGFTEAKISEMLNFISRCDDINCNATKRIHGKNDLLIPFPENTNEYISAGHIVTMIENNANPISLAGYYAD